MRALTSPLERAPVRLSVSATTSPHRALAGGPVRLQASYSLRATNNWQGKRFQLCRVEGTCGTVATNSSSPRLRAQKNKSHIIVVARLLYNVSASDAR